MNKLDQFTKPLRGTLLDIRYVPSTITNPVGFAYERVLKFTKDSHAHDCFVLCCPRGGTRTKIICSKTKKDYLNNSLTALLQPANFAHSVLSQSEIYENFALFISFDFFRTEAEKLKVASDLFSEFAEQVQVFKKTFWMSELIEQLFMAKMSITSRTLESEIWLAKELVRELLLCAGYLDLSPAKKSDTASLSGKIKQSLIHIEAHLFEQNPVTQIAKDIGLSLSSLQKIFKKELGLSPTDYIRKRRMEEASSLLQRGQHSVTQVSDLVGYQDATAFTRAFTKALGISPQKFKKTKSNQY